MGGIDCPLRPRQSIVDIDSNTAKVSLNIDTNKPDAELYKALYD